MSLGSRVSWPSGSKAFILFMLSIVSVKFTAFISSRVSSASSGHFKCLCTELLKIFKEINRSEFEIDGFDSLSFAVALFKTSSASWNSFEE